jgi:hypothetical protein
MLTGIGCLLVAGADVLDAGLIADRRAAEAFGPSTVCVGIL